MELDLKLTQIGLKMKNLVVLDLSFPEMQFPAFKSAYEGRLVHLPNRQDSALEFAAGLASLKKVVFVYGSKAKELNFLDDTLNVKLAIRSEEASLSQLEDKLREFGPSVLLIP